MWFLISLAALIYASLMAWLTGNARMVILCWIGWGAGFFAFPAIFCLRLAVHRALSRLGRPPFSYAGKSTSNIVVRKTQIFHTVASLCKKAL
jgi:hypothetical protein